MLIKLDIEITQKDIDTGERMNCTLCPNSIAVLRAAKKKRLSGINVVETGGYGSWVVLSFEKDDKLAIKYEAINIPDVLEDFVRDFDNADEVMPISYQLEFESVTEC